MGKNWIALVVLIGAAALPPHAAAQKTYRCGNTFQDRPCSAAPPAQPPAATLAPAVAAPAAPAADTRPAARPVQQSASAREAQKHQDQRHQDLCESLNMQLEDVRNRQRAGGPAETMDALGRQRHDIEGKLSANRCQ